MRVNVLFADPKTSGTLAVKYGRLESPERFGPAARVAVKVGGVNLQSGALATIVTVHGPRPFSFFLRDVASDYPVFIPEYGVAVVPGADVRDYAAVAAEAARRAHVSDAARMEAEPEETFENACRHNRSLRGPVWLGVGGDMRIFSVSPHRPGGVYANDRDFEMWGRIQPRWHSVPASLDQKNHLERRYQIDFWIGPGAHCRPNLTDRLDDGVLPILHAIQDEGSIQYRLTLFATLENGPLKPGAVRGTDWRAAYARTGINMLTPNEKKALQPLITKETDGHPQGMVCVVRVEAVNVSSEPAYAWFKAGEVAMVQHAWEGWKGAEPPAWADGFARAENRVAAVSRIDGRRMTDPEMAILVRPGERAVYDLLVPHGGIDDKRAERLLKLDYARHLEGCRAFWRDKLDRAAKISVPETAIDERIRAGLLHLDVNTLGRPKEGPLLPTIGWYSPIGTESAPIIQFFDAMGLGRMAGRCVDFFLARQREDGFIQNFNNYESETGPLLWTAAEHFRLAGDMPWLKRAAPKLKKACDYLLAWRGRNKKKELKKTGCYGLIDGKVADPDDFLHSFYLNAGTYAGLAGMADVLRAIDPAYAKKLAAEVKRYRDDLRTSAAYAFARAPVKPVGDGTWVSPLPPWPEYTGDISLYADGGAWFTHGSFAARSAIVGAMNFAITDVFDADGPEMTMLIKANGHPVTRENAAISQPYYCRHDLLHLRRGETKLFLKTFYNQVTALQDRQNYAFWEHYYFASEQKTHEEGWFLMQIRWMLWLEDGDALDLFKGVPRRWLEAGKRIELKGVKSHFGTLDAVVEAGADELVCTYALERAPSRLRIRLPHPSEARAVACAGGRYDPATETVETRGKKGRVKLRFTR